VRTTVKRQSTDGTGVLQVYTGVLQVYTMRH